MKRGSRLKTARVYLGSPFPTSLLRISGALEKNLNASIIWGSTSMMKVREIKVQEIENTHTDLATTTKQPKTDSSYEKECSR